MGGEYCANHCEHCKALQGDNFLHEDDPGIAFFPVEIEHCQQITLIEVPTKFDLTIEAESPWSSISEIIFDHCPKGEW